jgi:hypothetical protein
MGSYITAAGSYYEGDRASHLDAEVPQRPSAFSVWNGTGWSLDTASARQAAHAAIDAAAGAARGRYVTIAPGQEMTYLLKAQQAAAYKAASYPAASIAQYPFVEAKARATVASPGATDYQAAADLILATQAAWFAVGAAIEREREKGKVAVGAANDEAGITAARDAAVAALKAL